MKKILSTVLAGFMATSLVACSSGSTSTSTSTGGEEKSDMKVAMVTDYGDITDQSFNQTTYEACKEWASANGVDFNYFKPATN